MTAADRERAGREACPSTAAVDSQRARTTGAGEPHDYDAGNSINGRNRHLAKDFEAIIASATAFLYATSVRMLTRRLACSA